MVSQPQPRSVYVRRRLLLLAVILLLAWAVVQFWPFGGSDDPVVTSTVSTPSTSPTSVMPSATPVDASTTVKLAGGGKACDTKKVKINPTVPEEQHARKDVAIYLAVTTTEKKPCILKPKSVDPIAVIERDAKDVWDSSICDKPLLPKRLQLTPNWSTVTRILWTPRESGDECDDDEDWLSSGDYTLRLGMLGGEPGSTDFTLAKPLPKPKPTPTAKSTAKPKSKASAKPSPSPKPSAKKDDR
jgi:hypothetical protein